MPKKRGNNEGHVRKRSDGRWEGQFVAGRKSDGTPDRRSVYGKTQAEAQAKLAEALRQVRDHVFIEPSTITVKEWLHLWHKEYVILARKPTTASGYYDTIVNYIAPAIGGHKLQKLRIEHVQAFYNSLTRSGKAPATVAKAHRVLHASLKQAETNGLIPKNVAKGTNLPKQEQEEVKYLSTEEQTALLAILPNSTNGRALRFILGTGLRAAEIVGLRWSDVKEGYIEVAQTIQRSRDFTEEVPKGTKIYTTKPKSRSSVRSIPLNEKLRDLLSSQRSEQNARRLKLGGVWTSNDLVFAASTGKPMDARNLGRTLHAQLNKIEAEKRGLHALRHTFGTRAIENGVDPRTLSEIMGHKDVATTLRLYVHSSMDTKKKAMESLADLL